MKKSLIFSAIILVFSLSLISGAEARSGCCSHHSGVCGCGCCDGSSLSATCAPYYPSCNQTAINTIVPVKTVAKTTVKKTATVKTTASAFVGKPKTYAQLYSCLIVGNYTSMIYFPKGSSYIKKMTLPKKECFASAAKATAKGFRKVK